MSKACSSNWCKRYALWSRLDQSPSFFFASMPFDDSSGSNKDCFEMIKSIQGSSWNALTRVAPSSHLVCDLKGQADKDSSTDPRGKVSILQSIEIYFLWFGKGRSPEAV